MKSSLEHELRSTSCLKPPKMVSNPNRFQIFSIGLLILVQACLVTTQIESRIVGGKATTINRVPYLVHLLDNGKFFCGGTIVANRYIVTAAHCVNGVAARRLTVVAGTGQLSRRGVRSKVVKVMVPKGFNRNTMTMDVAVLKLKTPLKGAHIRAIQLCNQGWKPGSTFKVSGWGLTTENARSSPNQVRTVNVRSVSKAKCSARFRQQVQLSKTMFCASIPGRKDACAGDSGGPAVFNGKLCGIVSWGIGCARRAYPGVYTNVNQVKRFIRNAMKK